ncbi:methylisocitrate lyase-like protein [Amniculicola lignicola CBS 123094]|uniref:Methylisocitrate lyase-like protein n=1 Tax=Amniculicola lignicola CBS 123094 TaxID=1392246 RepID=A0A6A5WVH6_9PLEO|nr:methylisocitrate lyase-like protein [Amniculicola lignicola CBS 123094]
MATNGSNGTSKPTAVQKLRAMIADKNRVIACPGVYDGYTARIALQEGCDVLYMTGAGTTMSVLGMADMGVATLNDMKTNAEMIANLNPDIPLIADADTGYGGAIMVGRTVTQYMRAGVSGLHIEDQVQTKRCGHLKGKELVDTSVYASRIKAAVMAREAARGDIVIIARTDALQSLGYEGAMERMRAAVKEGADVAFLEGVTSKEMAEQFCKDMAPTPCLYNNVAGGLSPDFTAQEAKGVGYKIIIFPALVMEVVYPAVRKAVREMLDEGKPKSVEKSGYRYSPKELFEVCGLKEAMDFDVAAGGTAYSNGA